MEPICHIAEVFCYKALEALERYRSRERIITQFRKKKPSGASSDNTLD